MLDDLKIIHERDKSDALGVAEKQPAQLLQKFNVELKITHDIRSVVVAGMGGSGWPAWYLKSWPSLSVPFEVVSDYNLPDYVGSNTLVVVSSFSGNTEETLSTLDDAQKRKATIVVVTAGGKLIERAKNENIPYYQLPQGTQPRMSTFYFLAVYIDLLESLSLIKKGSTGELHSVSKWLDDQVKSWLPSVTTSKNIAKQLA
ncbi:MAG: hypothetical protein AAB459_01050 [Patescibacteria group bacterium]